MKRAIFLVGLVLAMIPAPAAAAGLTPYVQKVTERVEKALNQLEEKESTFTSFTAVVEMLFTASTAIFGVGNSNVSQTRERQDLVSNTACMHADRMILIGMMEDVQDKINEYSDPKKLKFFTIAKLQSIHEFLQQRLDAFDRGALDPAYADVDWPAVWNFDMDKDGNAPALDEEPLLCPYSTRYFDIGASGDYGCTPDQINLAIGTLPTDAKYDGLRLSLAKERDAQQLFLDELRKSRDADNELSDDAPDPFSDEPKQEDGCQADWKAEYPSWPSDLRVRDTGGFWKVAGERLRRLVDLLKSLEPLRPLPEELTKDNGNFSNFVQRQRAQQIQTFGHWQTRADVTVLGGVLEAKEIEDAFGPLTKTVGRLARVSHDFEGGIRGFVSDFAYYLRRSCMNRDCNARLERILKIVPKDECFPYTNGEAKGQGATEEEINEAIDNCKEAAEIDSLDGR